MAIFSSCGSTGVSSGTAAGTVPGAASGVGGLGAADGADAPRWLGSGASEVTRFLDAVV